MNHNKKPKKLKLEELGRVSIEEFHEMKKIPLILVLDNIRSMHNVGSIFRTADAFRVEQILLCGITPTPPHREITKSALGATESVNWQYFETIESAIPFLKENSYSVLGIEQVEGAYPLQDYPIRKDHKYALVYGNEVEGLSEEFLTLYDAFIEIPQEGTKHSLNVSISAGISIWEFYKNIK